MKYFHELTSEEIKDLQDKKKTWADIQSEYKPPEWCLDPNALIGIMGCWSLCNCNRPSIISREFCRDCEVSKDFLSTT